MNRKLKSAREWFNQAKYDLETAEAMFKAKRYIYTIFMCHLSLEKALKGLHTKKFSQVPPKIHNLIYLIEKMGLKPPEEIYDSIFSLNRVSIPTRYPDDLPKMLKEYNQKSTKAMLKSSEEALEWLKTKL
jgi:HEPN domain-containing protein